MTNNEKKNRIDILIAVAGDILIAVAGFCAGVIIGVMIYGLLR